MEFNIKELGEFIFISSNGKTREEALEKLTNHLKEINMESKDFILLKRIIAKAWLVPWLWLMLIANRSATDSLDLML